VIRIWLILASLAIASAETKTFQVKYADPEQLRRIFSGQSYVMEADRDLKLLTVHGPAAFLKDVEDTVKRLDVAPPLPANIQMTVYLLSVVEQASSLGTLPPELAGIGELKALRLADCQMVRMRAGQPAETMGSATSPPTAATLSHIRLEAASVHPDTKGDSISLDGLRIWLNVPGVESKSNGDVAVDIDVAQNQPVVVAKTGIDKPLVVVVRASVLH
jgi:hypothetical protein